MPWCNKTSVIHNISRIYIIYTHMYIYIYIFCFVLLTPVTTVMIAPHSDSDPFSQQSALVLKNTLIIIQIHLQLWIQSTYANVLISETQCSILDKWNLCLMRSLYVSTAPEWSLQKKDFEKLVKCCLQIKNNLDLDLRYNAIVSTFASFPKSPCDKQTFIHKEPQKVFI